MSGQPVRLYTWPDSQICLDCEYAEDVMQASVICTENCGDNDGISCNKYDKKKE
jgi:hypothetical protein